MPQHSSNPKLTPGDLAIIQEAQDKDNFGIFTNYYFRRPGANFDVYPETPRHAVYEKFWKSNGKPKEFVAELSEIPYRVTVEQRKDGTYYVEDRGYLPLPWHLEFSRVKQKERYVIGLAGCAKTMGMAALSLYMCATIDKFKFVNVAPTALQAEQMLRAAIDIVEGTPFIDKFIKISQGKWYVERPYIKITFLNGSEWFCYNVQKNAKNLQSTYGDWYNIDEAGNEPFNRIDEEGREMLAGILLGIVTRMRATAPDGRPRWGLLSLISNAYDCDTMWERFEEALKRNPISWGRLVTHAENPYITGEQLAAFTRNARATGKEDQWMKGIRPSPKGALISPKIVDPCLSEERQKYLESRADDPGYHYEIGPGGIWFEEPPKKDHIYMMVGDPGTGSAPDRNAPIIGVFDVTDFPEKPCPAVCMWWGDGGGSYLPFVMRFEAWAIQYQVPPEFRGYDSTSNQKAIAELSWESRGMEVIPLGFDGIKKWMYLNALQLILGKGLLLLPKMDPIRRQLTRYVIPDKKIPQDIVSMLAMACFLLFPLYRMAYPEIDETDEGQLRSEPSSYGRDYRPSYDRDPQPRL
jgi:hypothetical protein